jgi:hypothetical protein
MRLGQTNFTSNLCLGNGQSVAVFYGCGSTGVSTELTSDLNVSRILTSFEGATFFQPASL